MNCEKCQELLSEYLDGTLTSEDRAVVGRHLQECFSCVGVRDELMLIVCAAQEGREQYESPPNERALWLRIRNTIEAEEKSPWAAAVPARVVQRPRVGFLSRLTNMRWEMTLPQLTTAIAGIVVAVSLATALGLQHLQRSEMRDDGTSSARSASATRRPRRDIVQSEQVRVEYLKAQVEQRKASWTPRLRDAYDRSINVIDQAVNDSLNELERNPHDEVAEEMLNGALRNKLEFLREFSEQ